MQLRGVIDKDSSDIGLEESVCCVSLSSWLWRLTWLWRHTRKAGDDSHCVADLGIMRSHFRLYPKASRLRSLASSGRVPVHCHAQDKIFLDCTLLDVHWTGSKGNPVSRTCGRRADRAGATSLDTRTWKENPRIISYVVSEFTHISSWLNGDSVWEIIRGQVREWKRSNGIYSDICFRRNQFLCQGMVWARCFSEAACRTVVKYIWRFAAGVPIRIEKCHGLGAARRCSQESGRPNVSCATPQEKVSLLKWVSRDWRPSLFSGGRMESLRGKHSHDTM